MPTYIDNWLLGTLKMTYSGNQYENTFSLRHEAGPVDGAALTSLAHAWWDAVVGHYRGAASNQVLFNSVSLRDMSGPSGEQGEYIPVGPFPGLQNIDPVPFNAAAVISLRSARVGRSGRGRFYALGLGEQVVSGNFINSSQVAQLSLIGTDMMSFQGDGTTDVTAVVASRVLETLFDIIATQVENLVDSQRRRLQGRGR